jgi:hypothetical protein
MPQNWRALAEILSAYFNSKLISIPNNSFNKRFFYVKTSYSFFFFAPGLAGPGRTPAAVARVGAILYPR